MNILEIHNLQKKFPGAKEAAVKDFNISMHKGEVLALLGESGSGKTTILRMIAGFERPTKGKIILNGQVVADDEYSLAPEKRQIGIVFQDYALFPHKTVAENIEFGLFRFEKDNARQRITEIMELTALQGLENRYPHQLSGGQKQRVALARALAPKPQLILFDEPFSNIDTLIKNQMRDEISSIIKASNVTAVFVTHDTRDAMALADRIVVLKNGKTLQTASPEEIYHKPSSAFVADFFGKTNLFEAHITHEGLSSPLGIIQHTHIQSMQSGRTLYLSIRPDTFVIQDNPNDCIMLKIKEQRFMGEYNELHCQAISSEGNPANVVIHTSPSQRFEQQVIFVNLHLTPFHLLENLE